MSLRSVNNSSNVNLGAGKSFIGTYDSVLPYASAVVVLNSDQNCEITVYQSTDKIRTFTTALSTTGGVTFTTVLNLTAPNIYFVVKNLGSVTTTYFQFEVIYREVAITQVSPPASNVNIFSSTGATLNSTSGSLNVYDANLAGCISSGRVAVNLDAYPSQNAISFNGTYVAPFNKTNVTGFSNRDAGCTKVCLFGTISALAGGSTPLNITICFSNDGSTWFESSLGAITFTTTGDFSRDFETSAQFVGYYFDSAATGQIYYNLSG